ncbi:luciferase family oxidoreductase, FMN-dependent, PP_0088 family [Gemella bergeri ATCC 700627]|uniref:Luciferase family oxidoreductase, FMN-dependent, PP_0088 family n=1 Tax=Gemella bergeri ATCC 700627 TaxID=1321820 RepID=U2QB20_9BACL|nr:LLM class flavin-dependent oxidoreductase [Gemella bergeri]ERK60020.1 luciferase family oxidoreductase, FMN-dependent, PP_0088 family [Gemella bergeri ATCC 700627]
MRLSVLNLVPLRQDESFKDAMDAMVRLAKKVEKLGYTRYWIAEHHNMKNVASSATQLLIQHTLANTDKIRVGSGGVMLPNHSPYIVAEQYGTIDTLYPKRVDLGLGRAPGTDYNTSRAIRRVKSEELDFKKEVNELAEYFKDERPVHAYPAAGRNVPLYILGSSTDSAYLAAELGLPYSFAAHFAPSMMENAIAIYRHYFKPSSNLKQPYVILGANAVVADTDEEAKKLSTTQLQAFVNIVTNNPQGLQPPLNSEESVWKNYAIATKVPHFGPIEFDYNEIVDHEKSIVEHMTKISFIGSKDTVRKQIENLKRRVNFDELLINSYIYDEQAQHYSYQLLAEVVKEM